MLGNLLLAIGISTGIGTPLTQQPNNAVVSYDYEYQYQTNEVNSLDDLIVGNIYHVKFSNKNGDLLNCIADDYSLSYYCEGKAYNLNFYENAEETTLDEITLEYYNGNFKPIQNYWLFNSMIAYEMNQVIIDYQKFAQVSIAMEYDAGDYITSADMILEQNTKDLLQQYIQETRITFEDANFFSKSDYLGELVQVETSTKGLYDSIEEFIETYLYGNEKLQSTEYTIMGTTYNMAEWLAHTTTIILISLIIFVLVMLIKWLFKQIGNTFNLVSFNA